MVLHFQGYAPVSGQSVRCLEQISQLRARRVATRAFRSADWARASGWKFRPPLAQTGPQKDIPVILLNNQMRAPVNGDSDGSMAKDEGSAGDPRVKLSPIREVDQLTCCAYPLSSAQFRCCGAFGHDLGFGRRWMLTAETEKGLKRGHRRSSSVVTEDELVEVDLQMLGARAAVGAAEPAEPIRGLE